MLPNSNLHEGYKLQVCFEGKTDVLWSFIFYLGPRTVLKGSRRIQNSIKFFWKTKMQNPVKKMVKVN